MAWYWIFPIYWLIFFVGFYIVLELGQGYFYDAVTPMPALKVGLSSLCCAGLLTWWNPEILSMFADGVGWTLGLGVLAFVLFVVGLQFHPPHALLLGPLTAIFLAAMTAMAVDSLGNSGAAPRQTRRAPAPPRKGVSPEMKLPAADASKKEAADAGGR